MEHKDSSTQGRSTCQANYSYGQNTPAIFSCENWIVFHTFKKRQQQLT